MAVPCRGQVSFSSAISLALENSPRAKAAQNDLRKAQSELAVLKDIYIPSVVTGGGLGETYGITLSVPTIFTVNAQSLVYSPQQRANIRAAHFDLQAATLALAESRTQVEEDAAITYVSLENSQKVVEALTEQYRFAMKLVSIVQDRVNANLDSDLELIKARRGAIQIKLQQMQAEDDAEGARAHLSQLTGISADQFESLAADIPSLPGETSTIAPTMPDSPGILAAEANLKAKEQRARGDAEYAWRPQISFGAQYGRISPINDVSSFYNLHGNYNTANIGIVIQFPLLDKVRKAAAQISSLDASRGALDLEGLRFDQGEGRRKLQRSILELRAKADLADLDLSIAQNELQSTTVQLHASSGGPPLTPKEEQTAHLQERQRYLDLLDARLQLRKAQISLLRQNGHLDDWLRSLTNTPPGTE
ncbi:MAG TPA: TolC family protein [Terracidiphilus sp.]|nr:TolC family protein [Terracidiphilus sp.]